MKNNIQSGKTNPSHKPVSVKIKTKVKAGTPPTWQHNLTVLKLGK